MFSTYFQLGWHHIANLLAYDHLVFILAMSAGKSFKDWKKLAILVTAFTIGHSVTLALGTLRIVIIPTAIIEFLIPATILATALFHLFTKFRDQGKFLYIMVLLFGLIHGLGFSNFLVQTLSSEESILVPLLGFNLGLEVGQLLILSVFLVISQLVSRVFGFPANDWAIYVCGLASGIAMILMINTKFW
ncbi:MAG: HupE/UreJ family protein [Bacteroidota bacterium]